MRRLQVSTAESVGFHAIRSCQAVGLQCALRPARETMTTAIRSVHGTLDPFFAPRSVAVVGAGRRRGSIGAEIFINLTGTFRGDVYAVNPHGHTIDDLPAWPTLSSIPWPVDLC